MDLPHPARGICVSGAGQGSAGGGANEAEKGLQKDGTQPKGPWKEVGQGERKALTGRRPAV